MHAIARIAIFRDERMVVEHPELAVQSRKNHTAWRENGKLVWTDPSNPKVQDYDIALAKYVAQLGADEIQFDYVRFPAEGDQKDAQFVFQSQQPDAAQASSDQAATAQEPVATAASAVPPMRSRADTQQSQHQRIHSAQTSACHASPTGPQRTDVITAFLKKAYAELHPTGVLLSLDVFGVMAWQRQVDLSHTGQDIVGMAHYCDVLSPMIYPVALLRHGQHRPPRRRARALHRRVHGPLRTHHPKVAASSSAPGCKPSTGAPKPTRPNT